MTTDISFDVVVHNVPKDLLDEFDELVVKKSYPGGRSEALRDCMRKAIQEHRDQT